MQLKIEQVGLAAYLVMNKSNNLKYLEYNNSCNCFIFESSESQEYWENRYDLSNEKKHDSIVMRLRKYKSR